MIQVNNLTKSFQDVLALDHVTANIKDGQVFGLIGTNGAGKSTFLKLCSGILKPDEGSVLIDETPIYENIARKQDIFYISDDQYFFKNTSPKEMMEFYKTVYPFFDSVLFEKLLQAFGLPQNRKVNTYSKGMKKQLSITLGISSNTKYLLCDETFDGLDPVMRQAVKSLFAEHIETRALTPIVASHNLRELEDICDHVGLLHKGGILFSKDIDDMKTTIHKAQIIFKENTAPEEIHGLDIMYSKQSGSFYTLTIRGEKEDIINRLNTLNLLFFELVPLSLEEIFISETEVNGYDIKNLIL